MNKKVNVNDQLSRMKGLMNYGLQTESKNNTYSSVEYQKLGADGNVYGIIREGSKYYIETAPNKKTLVKEDFNYIGGFKNRKDNEYSSFAAAQKNFDLKLMSIREAYSNGKNIVIESWNPDKKENLTLESTEKMRKEILRERQIMYNAACINESKPQSMTMESDNSCGVCGSKECKDEDASKSADVEGYENLKDVNPKDSFRKSKHQTGKAKEANNYKEVKESAEPLAWHQTGQDAKGNMADTYMDKSHGTEVGDSAPFDEETVEEGVAMHDADNQNTPNVGVNKVGDSAPFDKETNVNEGLDEIPEEDPEVSDDVEDNEADTELDNAEDVVGDEDVEDGAFDAEGDDFEDDEEDDFDDDEEFDEDDLSTRVEAMEDTLEQIAQKLGIDTNDFDTEEFEDDDDLYSDNDETEDEFGDGIEDDEEDDFDEDEMPMESKKRKGYQIFESRAFKKAKRRMNEGGMKPFSNSNRVPNGNMNALDEFGKHPSYRKQPMTTPTKNHQEFDGYYDMNDESAKNDTPFGTNIGSGAPFDLDIKTVENSIAESIRRNLRNLKKKSKRK